MILSVVVVAAVLHGGSCVLSDVLSLDVVKKLPAAGGLLAELEAQVSKLNLGIPSATFGVFHPDQTDEEFNKGHAGFEPRKDSKVRAKRSNRRSKKIYG